MRLLIAMMKHETNTFSPVPTPLARFGRYRGPGPLYGEAAIQAYRGTGSGLGAYLDLAEREGAEVVAADRRRRAAEPPGRGRRLRAHRRHHLRRRRERAASTASCSTCTARW